MLLAVCALEPVFTASRLCRKERAPTLRANGPVNHFAGARRLEKATSIAALWAFRLILVRDRVLGHLGLCGGNIRTDAADNRCTDSICRQASKKSTS